MLNLTILKAWILSILIALDPNTVWRETYDKTAETYAASALKHQLFSWRTVAGWEQAVKKTAATYVAVSWFESHFQPDAKGDCAERNPDGTCKKGGIPTSFCAFQINQSNFKALGVTKQELLESIEICTETAHRMMVSSFSICGGRADERDLLNHYALGGEGCSTTTLKGRHRMEKARWIIGHFPLDVK